MRNFFRDFLGKNKRNFLKGKCLRAKAEKCAR